MKIELNEKERVMLKQYTSLFEDEREIDLTANPIKMLPTFLHVQKLNVI